MKLKNLLACLLVLSLSATLSTTTSAETTNTSPTAVSQDTSLATEAESDELSSQTLLQQDLINLLAVGQNLQKEALAQQKALEKQFKIDSKKATTPAKQRALQQQLLSDVLAFKIEQKQQLANCELSEPNVIAVRDNMLKSLEADISSLQIALDNPTPTQAAKKQFEQQMKLMKSYGNKASVQLHKLLVEAGMREESHPKKHKKHKKSQKG